MHKNATIREEEIIVIFTKQKLEENLSLNAESLRKQLLKNYENLKLTKNIAGMSPKSLENYLVMAKLLRRLSKLREQNAAGAEFWTDEDYRVLQSSGILLNNCVRTINKLSSTAFLSVLKKVVYKLPCDRAVVDRTVNTEIGMLFPTDIAKGSHDEHNNIKDLVGKQFLHDIGCHFVTTEVTLEKGEKPVRGLKIDVFGWKNDGTICGIEVKANASDYFNTKVDIRYDRYARYVNEMYILTADEYSYNDAINWRKRTNHNEVGILLYDKDVDAITKRSQPIETRKEVTSMMLECVQRALLTKAYLHPRGEENVTYLIRSDDIEITLSKGRSLSPKDIFKTGPKPKEPEKDGKKEDNIDPKQPSERDPKIDRKSTLPMETAQTSADEFDRFKKKKFVVSLYPDEYDAIMSSMKEYGYKRADFVLACVNSATKGTMEKAHKKIVKSHNEIRKEQQAFYAKQQTDSK